MPQTPKYRWFAPLSVAVIAAAAVGYMSAGGPTSSRLPDGAAISAPPATAPAIRESLEEIAAAAPLPAAEAYVEAAAGVTFEASRTEAASAPTLTASGSEPGGEPPRISVLPPIEAPGSSDINAMALAPAPPVPAAASMAPAAVEQLPLVIVDVGASIDLLLTSSPGTITVVVTSAGGSSSITLSAGTP